MRSASYLYWYSKYLNDNDLAVMGHIFLSKGSLRSLAVLNLRHNQISDPGMIAFSNAIRNGSLPSLQMLGVDDGPLGTEHPQLKAVCEARGIDLPYPP